MKGPRNAVIAHKKPDMETLKTRKAEQKTMKEKGSKKKSSAQKDTAAPKRPPSAFFIFMEGFRKSFQQNCPDGKVTAAAKAGGEKWKSMSDTEKAPYAEQASKRKAEYEKAVAAYKKELNENQENEKPESSDRSTSEVQDDLEQEASSQRSMESFGAKC